MSSTATFYATKSALVENGYATTDYNDHTSDVFCVRSRTSAFPVDSYERQALIGFNPVLPSSVYKILSVTLVLNSKQDFSSGGGWHNLVINNVADFDEDTVTGETFPAFVKELGFIDVSQSSSYSDISIAITDPQMIQSLMSTWAISVRIHTGAQGLNCDVKSSHSASDKPKLVIEYQDTDSTSNAECVSPKDAYVETTEQIKYRWNHSIDTGTDPTGYDLQYKLQSAATWTDMASATDTSDTSYTMAANTLSGGKYQWRVRTLNQDGNAGNWSDPANFTARGAPLAPFVQTTSYTASRPTITWTSTGQVGFKMMIYTSAGKLEYDSGEVASAERQHKVNAYLGNGSHIMRLYVINEYGIKSATSEVTLTIAFSAPVAPTVAGEPVAGGAKVTVTGQYSKIYILRDGVPIAKTMGTYIDYMSVGSHQYVARGVDASDNFADSDPVTVETVITTSCIANVDAPSTMAALRLTRGNPERIGYGFARQAIAFQFSGRKLPVYEFGEAETNNYTLNYIVRSKGDFETLRNIVTGRTAVYRTASERHYVVVTEISATKDNIGTDYTLIATETDYKERIDYD